MVTTDPQEAPELQFLVSPWAFAFSFRGERQVHSFHNAPFYNTKKGCEELAGLFEEAPTPADQTALLCFASTYYTLVPEDLYDEADKQRVMRLTFSEDFSEEELRSDRSMVSDARIVHWWPSILSEKASENYPGYLPEHFSVKGIAHLLALNTKMGAPCAIAHIRHGELDVGFASRGMLRSFNSFSYANAEELVYFLLHAWRSYASGESIGSFHLTGTTAQGDEVELLQRYVEGATYHSDGKGNWCSFFFEDIISDAHHQRSS